MLRLGPYEGLGVGWSWDGALPESSEQKPQLLVNVRVHGPGARWAAVPSSELPSCPAAPSVLLFAERGNSFHLYCYLFHPLVHGRHLEMQHALVLGIQVFKYNLGLVIVTR